MFVPLKIALRYLFSKKSINLVNIIAGISAFGVMIASAALIIILSVFNGLEDIIVEQFNHFDPELKISLKEGKYFNINDSIKDKLNSINNIQNYAFSLEDKVVIKYGKTTHPFLIHGIDKNYTHVNPLSDAIVKGTFSLHEKNSDLAIIGIDIAEKLSIGIGFLTPIIIYAPTQKNTVQASEAFKKRYIYPSGIYNVDPSVNDKIIVNLSFAQELFSLKNQATNIYLKLKKTQLLDATKQELEQKLLPVFSIKDRYEQNDFYKVINSERLMIYVILGFVLLIAAFNITATLSMLILDKKADFITFQSIGLSHWQIKLIFLLEAWLTTLMGALLGLLIGGILAYLQEKYGWIRLGGENAYVDMPYPVAIVTLDFLKIGALIMLVSLITSIIPIRILSKKYL